MHKCFTRLARKMWRRFSTADMERHGQKRGMLNESNEDRKGKPHKISPVNDTSICGKIRGM